MRATECVRVGSTVLVLLVLQRMPQVSAEERGMACFAHEGTSPTHALPQKGQGAAPHTPFPCAGPMCGQALSVPSCKQIGRRLTPVLDRRSLTPVLFYVRRLRFRGVLQNLAVRLLRGLDILLLVLPAVPGVLV